MKIGLARRGYSPTGGAEKYLGRLLTALHAAGHEAVLFASSAWPPDQRPPGTDFFPVAGRLPVAFADALAKASPSRCDRLFSLERLWRCDCYRAGDGVHRAWLERRARAERWWQPLLRRFNRKHRQLLALEESLFARDGARRIIVNSRLVQQEIVEHYGTPAERIFIVYNGLPSAYFHLPTAEERHAARTRLGLHPEDFAILFAGTGWERKGLRHALRAVSRLPDQPRPILLVAGRGNPRPYLREISVEARGRVRFLGPVRDMRALYAAADVFVAPTLYDPFANACLEALAAGLPVLTTTANGFSELIEPGTHGETFDPADAATGEHLAALLTRWSDPSQRLPAHPVCAARASAFSIEKNVVETLPILLG